MGCWSLQSSQNNSNLCCINNWICFPGLICTCHNILVHVLFFCSQITRTNLHTRGWNDFWRNKHCFYNVMWHRLIDSNLFILPWHGPGIKLFCLLLSVQFINPRLRGKTSYCNKRITFRILNITTLSLTFAYIGYSYQWVKKCHFDNFSERAGMAVPC